MRSIFALLLALPCAAFAEIHYTLKPDVHSGTINVNVKVEASGPVEFQIPAWCPGYYQILNFQEKIMDVQANVADVASIEGGTGTLSVERVEPRTWKVDAADGTTINLSYKVKADDSGLGFFGASIHPHTAFINGPAVFMYVKDRQEEPIRLEFNLPKGWDIATGMDSDENGEYFAKDYDEFIDHPIQIGEFERRTFMAAGIPFEAVYVSTDKEYKPDLEQTTENLRKISEETIRILGPAPFKRYVYLVHLATGNFGGGLEHQASTVLNVPNSESLNMDTLAAHEFVHAWNVKNIRPAVLGPFDYTQSAPTGNLWFAEGVTDYYASLIVYHAGLRDLQWLLRSFSMNLWAISRSKTRKEMTIEQVCRHTWEQYGMGYGDLSFYNHGFVSGMLFDIAIRSATEGQRSLDDVMHILMERHALPKPGYGEDDLRLVINEVAGMDLTPLYNTLIRSTDDTPVEVLHEAGLTVGKDSRERPSIQIDPTASKEAIRLRTGWLGPQSASAE